MFISVFSKSVLRLRNIKPFFDIQQPQCMSVVSSRFRSSPVKLKCSNVGSARPLCTHPAVTDNTAGNSLEESVQYPIFASINYEEIAGNDEELHKKLNVVVDQMRAMAARQDDLPSCIKPHHWQELLELRSYAGRRKYLCFLFITEMKEKRDQTKKAERRKLREEMLKQKPEKCEDPDRLVYSLGDNCMFLRIYDAAIDRGHNFRALLAMMFGTKLVIDCSYDEYMVGQEMKSCAKQLAYLFGANRAKQCPLDLHFVNFNPESKLPKVFHQFMPTIYGTCSPFNWSPKSYLDLFPKEKLVYLTPHCEEVLDSVNHDDIYIIGAMVDKGICEPLSLTKAKRDGIRYAKLPLDEYLNWGFGGKSLTIDQCVNIVGDVLSHGSWEQALKAWVPQRKLFKDLKQVVSSSSSSNNSPWHLRNNSRRNNGLYDFLMNEQYGSKNMYKGEKWP